MVLFLGLAGIVGGFITVMPLFMGKYPLLQKIDEKISPYRILIGLAILIIGVIKFIVPYHGVGRPLIPIFGDLLPSILVILTGIMISIEYLENLKGVKGGGMERLKIFLDKYRYPIGFATIFFGFLHWIIFKVVFF